MASPDPKAPEKIALYTFYNSAFENLKDRFLSTIQDDYDIHCMRCDFDTGGQPIDKAVEMFIARGNIINQAISENIGKTIILADIDIQFFGKTEPIVRKAAETNRMTFQKGEPSSNRSKNMGFIALRCDEQVLGFWKDVLEEIKASERWEEVIVNEMLEKRKDIEYGLFPDEIWTPLIPTRPEGIVLHHAICAGVTERDKLRQMNRVSKAIEEGTFGSFVVRPAYDTLPALLRYVNMQRKAKGAKVAFTKTLPQVLYEFYIDRNIGKIGAMIRKVSPRLYEKLKPNA